MKKLFRLASAAVIIFAVCSLFAPVCAAETDGLEAAIAAARSKITIPAEYGEFTSGTNNEIKSNGAVYYDLRWATKDEESYIDASVSSYGDITAYRDVGAEEDYPTGGALPALDADEAKRVAYSYITELNPSWAEHLNFDGIICTNINIDTRYATVRMFRYVNGVRLEGDYVSVDVDVYDGSVRDFSSNWSYPGELQDPSYAISLSDATDKFKEYSDIEPEYVNNYDNDIITAKLVYHLKNRTERIDAVTEERIVYGENDGSGATAGESPDAAHTEADNIRYTEEELSNIETVASLLDESELRALAEAPEGFGLKSAEFVGADYVGRMIDGDMIGYNAHLDYSVTEGDRKYTATVSMNAETGEIFSFYRDRGYFLPTGDITLTYEDGLRVAEDYLSRYCDKYSSTAYEDGDDLYYAENNPFRPYYFYRYHEGIKHVDNYLRVTIDLRNGQIQRFYANWNEDLEYDPLNETLDRDTALDISLDQADVELIYAKPDYSKNDYQLTYSLNHKTNYISAISGEYVWSDASEYVPYMVQGSAVANDIAGHYAEKQIKTLLYYNVLGLEDGAESFRPDDIITKRELASFVASLKRKSYVPVASGVVQLENSGVAEDGELESDDPAKREDGVKYIVNALGYKEVALLEGIYTTPFLDEAEISQGYIGYVALAKGMNIISGDENSEFNPQEGLTRADAAIMIYNYLVN